MVTLVTVSGESNDAYSIPDGVKRIALNLDFESSSPWSSVAGIVRRVSALRRIVQDVRPDLVIGFQTTANIYAVFAAGVLSWGYRCPVLISERNYSPAIVLARSWKILRKLAYPMATEIVCLSERNVHWLRENRLSRKPSVIGNPVVYPMSRNEPVKQTVDYLSDNARVVLAVGRLVPAKGFDLLLQAFAKATSDLPEDENTWRLVILGVGDHATLEQQASSLGLSEHLILPGRAGNVGDWYARANVFVLSSRHEGFPNVLVEAMAHGLPVVATDCATGPSEIMQHEHNGLLVETENVDAMATGLRRLLLDEPFRQTLGNEAIAVRERFTPDSIFDLWLNAIERNSSTH